MYDIQLRDGRTSLYAGDSDCQIVLMGFGDEDITQVQFEDIQSTDSSTMDVEVEKDGDMLVCDIPNQLLNGTYAELICYVVAAYNGGARTIADKRFAIKPRQLSSGYVLDPTRILTWDDIITEAREARDDAKTSAEEASESAASCAASETSCKKTLEEVATLKGQTDDNVEEIAQAKSEIESVIAQAKTDISSGKSDALSAISTAKTEAVSAVSSQGTTSKKAVTDAESAAITAVSQAKSAAISAVQSQESSSKAAVQSQEASSKAVVQAYEQSAKGYADAAKESEEKALEYKNAINSYAAGDGLELSDNAFRLKIKSGEAVLKADSDGAYTDAYTKSEIDSKVSALEAQVIISDTAKVYKRSIYVKNGKPYELLEEVTA